LENHCKSALAAPLINQLALHVFLHCYAVAARDAPGGNRLPFHQAAAREAGV
jgi:hypothetical protein